MHFYIEKATLIEGISIVQKAMPSKSTLPITDGIYLAAFGDSLLLKCCDLSIQIETTVPADIREEGSIVLPSLFFEDVISPRFVSLSSTLKPKSCKTIEDAISIASSSFVSNLLVSICLRAKY